MGIRPGIFALILFFLLTMSGCGAAGEQPKASTRTPFQAVAPTQTAPATPTPLPTETAAPTVTPSPHPCKNEPGRIEVFEELFEGSPRNFHFRVYTPPCFEVDAGTRYPVLYMIHGQTYNDDQWERLGIADAAFPDRPAARAGHVRRYLLRVVPL
jgi:type IV secretory pathway VirB10-like protein